MSEKVSISSDRVEVKPDGSVLIDGMPIGEVMHDMEICFFSGAENEFVQWVDFAHQFVKALERSCLSGEQKSIVRRVLNMKEIQ